MRKIVKQVATAIEKVSILAKALKSEVLVEEWGYTHGWTDERTDRRGESYRIATKIK